MSPIANRTVNRSTRDTFLDHLARRMGRQTEADIELNYSDDVVLLTSDGLHYGREGVRHCAARLEELLPHARLEYTRQIVSGEVAFLEWKARSAERRIEDGVDTLVIRRGRIVAQTIHYTVIA